MVFRTGTFRDKDTDLVPLFEHWLDTKDNVVVSSNCNCTCIMLQTNYKNNVKAVVLPFLNLEILANNSKK
jgi:hypothetical protein